MLLIVSLNKHPLHKLEFVKPIEQICKEKKVKFEIKHYKEKFNSNSYDKIIICGTSLKDFDYYNNFKYFEWIKNCDKPILGICAGMQVIAKTFESSLRERIEIGETQVIFEKEFLGLNLKQKVYSLHKLGIGNIRREFKSYAKSNKGIQAIKHKQKPIYATMFHPEVWNKELIINFLSQ